MRGTDISKEFEKYKKPIRTEPSPDEVTVHLVKDARFNDPNPDLKYGENPCQRAAVYAPAWIKTVSKLEHKVVEQTHFAKILAELTNLRNVRTDGQGKGGLSSTNVMDACRAMDSLKWFSDPAVGWAYSPAVVILKHTVVSGFASAVDGECHGSVFHDAPSDGSLLARLYRVARDSDRRSNFGGTVATNQPIDMDMAEAILGLYPDHIVDNVAAVGFESGVVGKLESKKNIRIMEFARLTAIPKFVGDETYGLLSVKELPSGLFVVQDVYLTTMKSPVDMITDPLVAKDGRTYVIETDPTEDQARDLLTAWYLNITGARSNGVVFVKGGALVSMGSGQVERVGAVEQAIIKGMLKAMDREGLEYDALRGITGYEALRVNPFRGAVCASDAFFPFPDSIATMASVGVKAAIQPFGSTRDHLVIEEANQQRMAMPKADYRCFGHF